MSTVASQPKTLMRWEEWVGGWWVDEWVVVGWWVTIQRIMPLHGSILQVGTCQILSLVENPRWSRVWQQHCTNIVQILVKYWSNIGQIFLKFCIHNVKILLINFAFYSIKILETTEIAKRGNRHWWGDQHWGGGALKHGSFKHVVHSWSHFLHHFKSSFSQKKDDNYDNSYKLVA